MFLVRLRSSNPIHKIRHYNFSTLANPYPVPRDPSTSPLPAQSGGCAPHLHAGVMMMIKLSNLDQAAYHARFAISARPWPSTIRTCDALIGAMCSAGRYKDAFNYFHFFFNEYKLKPSISCCNHIIGALCHLGQVEEAFRFYNHASASIPPNQETYSHLAKGLVDTLDIKEAEDFITRVKSSDQVTPLVFNHLIRGFLALGRFYEALCVFQDAEQRLAASPIDYQASDLIHILIDEDYNGIAMMSATYIEYWFKQGDHKEAMKCYASLLDKSFVMNAVTGNTLLQILLDYGEELQAKKLFDQMVEKNADTVNIFVSHIFNTTVIHDQQAVDFFQRFGDGYQLCYKNLISLFCQQGGMLSEAESFFQEMRSKQFTVPDIPTYRLLLDAYANAGRFDDAERIMNFTVYDNLKCIAKFRLI